MTYKRHISKTLKLSVTAALLSFSISALADSKAPRRNSLPQSLLKKVLKPTAKIDLKKLQAEAGIPALHLSSKFNSWGVNPKNKKSSINILPAWKNFKQKKEIVVAVVDTGIDPNHPFLSGSIFKKKRVGSKLSYGADYSKKTKTPFAPFDTHGHGTHVSGIVKSVFPKVKILPVKYYKRGATGKENLDSTIKALRYAISMNVDIINYSGGGAEKDHQELKVLKEAEAKGILVVAAAGNEESNIDKKSNQYFPASYGLKNIISVTAHNRSLGILPSSNYGKQSVDIAAPGNNINSAAPQGRLVYMTGTSQATAFVTGVAALLMAQYPQLTAQQIKSIIKKSAKKEITMMTKCSSGGRLDAGKAQLVASQMMNTRVRNLAAATKKTTKKKTGKILYRVSK